MAREIQNDGEILARHIEAGDIAEGLSFFSKDEEFIQVGAWKYDAGKELLAHAHNRVEREVERTCETLCVIKGAIEATIYTPDANLLETFTVKAGDILILLKGGHGYRIIEDDTFVLEVKNGPYPGAEADRRRL